MALRFNSYLTNSTANSTKIRRRTLLEHLVGLNENMTQAFGEFRCVIFCTVVILSSAYLIDLCRVLGISHNFKLCRRNVQWHGSVVAVLRVASSIAARKKYLNENDLQVIIVEVWLFVHVSFSVLLTHSRSKRNF